MDPKWNDTQPIYRQLRDRVVTMILEGVVADGDALPSVRQVAAEYQLNPLTVLKGYQALVDEDLVEKKRGRGMYVKDGACKALMSDERRRFVDEQWPEVAATIKRLGLAPDELLASVDEAASRYAEKMKGVPGGNGASADGGKGDGDGSGEEAPADAPEATDEDHGKGD